MSAMAYSTVEMCVNTITVPSPLNNILTSDHHISGNRHAVHLGLNGTRIFPSMPHLNVPDHDVTSRALSVQKFRKNISKLQNDLKGPQKQVQGHSDFFRHSVYYIM